VTAEGPPECKPAQLNLVPFRLGDAESGRVEAVVPCQSPRRLVLLRWACRGGHVGTLKLSPLTRTGISAPPPPVCQAGSCGLDRERWQTRAPSENHRGTSGSTGCGAPHARPRSLHHRPDRELSGRWAKSKPSQLVTTQRPDCRRQQASCVRRGSTPSQRPPSRAAPACWVREPQGPRLRAPIRQRRRTTTV